MATLHHHVGCNHRLVKDIAFVSVAGVSKREGGDEFRVEIGAEKAGAHADGGAGVEHRVDAAFGVVAHNQTAELLVGLFHSVCEIVPQADVGVVVLEVGAVGGGAEVAPLADDAVAEETIVRLVGVAENDHIAQFTAP